MKIIADTATLFSPAEGEANGMTIVPVSVAINNTTYKDYVDISSAEFLRLIAEGGTPTSSQPSVGEILEALEDVSEDVILLTVADGLSGGYQSAMGARNLIENNQHIHVINSKSLAGPLRYLAKKAVALNKQGVPTQQALQSIMQSVDNSISFVIPEDFEFLKRSGRLTAITARVGGVLKLLPILTQTDDRKRIKPIGVKRSWKSAVEVIINRLQNMEVNEDYLISICHAGTPEKAAAVSAQVKEAFPHVEIEILELCPALITHGGPGCIVIQTIKK
ncbi:MAG: DegV family protein [Oscillospiraceae bacterium]|nr:DegV family protein [Oscillospiraceae bacterium]